MAVTRQELESLTVSAATGQWMEILSRPAPQKGQRQGLFLAVEQVLAYAAMFVVDPASQGGSDWTRYHRSTQPSAATTCPSSSCTRRFSSGVTNTSG